MMDGGKLFRNDLPKICTVYECLAFNWADVNWNRPVPAGGAADNVDNHQ